MIAAALTAGGYLYFRLDDEIRRQLENRLASHYSQLNVHVGSAQFDKDHGITIRNVTFTDPQRGSAPPLLTVDELFLGGQVRVEQLLTGTLPIEQIVIRRPKIVATRQTNGSWNVSSLLPPPKFSDQAPEMIIEDATLTLDDASHKTARPLVMRGVAIKLQPLQVAQGAAMVSRRYHAVGTAAGLPGGELKFEGDLSLGDGSFNLTLTAAGLEVSPELLASTPIELPAALEGIEFSGRADIAVRLQRVAGPDAQIGWSTQLQLQRGRLRLAGWPQPLTDIAFVAQADRSRLSVKPFTAKWGAADMTLACDRNGWAADAPLGLSARLSNFPLDQDVLLIAPPQFAKCWRRFEPVGKVDVELRLAFNGQQWLPHITADCRGVSLTDNEKFSYRVEQAVGRVEYFPANPGSTDRLEINLTGSGAGRPVQIKANLTQLVGDASDARPGPTGVAADMHRAPSNAAARIGPNKHELVSNSRSVGYRGAPIESPADTSPFHPVGWVEISGTDIPLPEPQLLRALTERSPQGGQLVSSLRPQGAFDFRWRAEWKDRSQSHAATSLDLNLKDCNILFDRFAYPLRHVNGLVTERNRNWAIHDVEARGGNESTTIVCRGQATPSGDGQKLALVFQAINVPLDDNLKQALTAGAQQAWENLRPQGRVDFTAHVVHDTGQLQPPVIDVDLRPRERSVSIEPRQFPYRFEAVDGVARFSAGRVDIQDFSGRHGRANYSARTGTWQATESGGWQFTLAGVNVDRLEPDRDLIGAMPPGLQRVIERLQPSGTFRLDESALSFAKRPDLPQLAATWDVNLDCHQASLAGGMQLANISGGVRLAGRADNQATYTAGTLKIDSLTWKGMQLTAVRGPLFADSTVCLFGRPADAKLGQPQPQTLTADAYGGSLTADIRLDHDENSPYRIDMAIGGADLARFATERLGGPKELTGTVSGKLSLAGAGQSTRTLLGAGELHVVDANIYEVPVVVSLLSVLRNRAPNTTAFNRCDIKFQIHGEDIVFNQLNLLGDAMSLYGKGQTNFDRKLNLEFYPLMGLADVPIPFYKTILGQASKQTLQVKATGTWDVPHIETKALPGVNDAWKQIQTELETGVTTVSSPSAMREAIAPHHVDDIL